MECNEVKEYLYEYTAKRLDESVRTEIDSHLKTCSDCRQALQELQIDLDLLENAKPPQVADDFKDKVISRLNDNVVPIGRKKVYRYVLQGAVAAVFVFAVFVTLKPKPQVDEITVMRGETANQTEVECQKAVDLYNKGTTSTDLNEKEELFKEALSCGCEIKQVLAGIHNSLGDCYEKKGNLDEALKEYERSIEIYSFFALPYLGIGDVYKKKGMYDEKVRFYKKAILLIETGENKDPVNKKEFEELKKEVEELKEKLHE
jgi:tetratricopeptide (TPR) repeat protein